MFQKSLFDHIWDMPFRLLKRLPVLTTMPQESFHIHLYYEICVMLFFLACCCKMISLLCTWSSKRLEMAGTVFEFVPKCCHFLIVVFPLGYALPIGTFLFQIGLIFIAFYLFDINFNIYLILLQIYCNIYWQNIPFHFINFINIPLYVINMIFNVSNIIIILTTGASKTDQRNAVTEIGQHNENINIEDSIALDFLAYSICLVHIPYFLNIRNFVQTETILITSAKTICMTSICTMSYITILSNICFIFPKIMLWLLRGEVYKYNISEVSTPFIVMGILSIQSFDNDVRYIGTIICLGIFLVVGSDVRKVHTIANSFLLELGSSGDIIFRTCKSVSIVCMLIISLFGL